MAEDGKIIYKVTLDDSGVESAASSAGQKSSNAFSEIWTGALRRIGEGFVELAQQGVNALADITKASLESTAKLEQNIGGVETLFEESADTVIANAEKAYSTAGLSANEYMETVTSFSASLIQATGRGAQQDLAVLESTLADEYTATKRALEDQYDATKDTWDAKVKLAKSTEEKDALKAQRDEILKDLKRNNEDQLAALKEHNKEALAEAEAANRASTTTTESLARAAELADQAIIDMSDNANKMGTDISAIQSAYSGFAKQNYTMLDNLKLGYGGTKEEMERLISDANKVKEANGEMADLSIDSFADITEAIHIIQTEMGITGTTAKEASTTIEGSMNAAKAAYDNFLNGSGSAEEFAAAIMTAATNISNNLVEIVQRFATEIPELVMLLGEQLPEIIGTLGPPIFQAVTGIIGALISLFIEHLPEFINSGLNMLMSLLTGIGNALPRIIPVIVTVITTILTGLMNHLPEIISAGIQILVGLITGLIDALPQLIAMLPTIISTIVTVLIQNSAQLTGAALQIILAIGKGLIQNLPQLIAMLPQIITAIYNSFVNTDWASIGSNIVNGIWNGITSLWNSLVDAVQNMVSNLWSGVKNVLGISSPSKKFKYIGEMSVEGMEEGFEEGEDDLEKTVHSVYDTMLNAAGGGTGASRGAMEQAVSYSLQATGRGSDMTIVVPLSIDGREIARATAWSMGEQLAWEEM